MTASVQSANVYTDLQSLNRLKNSAEQDPEESLRFVAQQFEAMFLQMMLKSTHEFDEQDGLFDSEQTEFYQDWHDKQMSIHLSSGKGIGIADMLVEQLRRQGGGITSSMSKDLDPNAVSENISVFPAAKPEKINSGSIPQQAETIDSPLSFVEKFYPMAEEAAERLGVSAEVLLAQAALETGWGKKISTTGNGQSSHNLFNIKADSRWNGEKVQVPTLEYRDGVATREYAHFRAYDSFESSFEDYVNFIQESPRYQSALDVAADKRAYTDALAQAGYATDPEYSNKIMNIVDGEHLNTVLAAIKL